MSGRRIDAATTEALRDALREGDVTIVVPLGSTEQHGAHLPLGTDTLIADALADRLCARHREIWALPALALGCADEHLGFVGTMSLGEATLHAVLLDVLRSAAQHGFARAFVFSAHGGNAGALDRLAPKLADEHLALGVHVFSDLDAVVEAQASVAARFDVSPEAAGHHAGEWETSVVAALAPGSVHLDRAEPGIIEKPDDVQSLFYPRLDIHAPNGVVGDPRGADPARAEVYLAAWVDVLDQAYARAFG